MQHESEGLVGQFKTEEMALASTITISHLLQKLVEKGVLSKEESADVLNAAANQLDSIGSELGPGAAAYIRHMFGD